MEPTPSVVDGVEQPCRAIDENVAKLSHLMSGSLAHVNELLAKDHQEPLPVWTPPAAPACGAGSDERQVRD
jgi:hypothetical protein